MIGSCLSNTPVFGNYNYFNNPAYAGSVSGFIGSIILNPFETRKVQEQLFKRNIKIKQPLFSALNYMVLRETLSNAIIKTTSKIRGYKFRIFLMYNKRSFK